MDWDVGNLNYLYLFVLVAIGFAVTAYGVFVRGRAAKKFAAAKIRKHLIPATTAKHVLSAILVLASLALMAIAMLDIRWGKTWQEVPQKGIEVMFALDVSRSMLAEDIAPNRLARAKQQVSDMVDEMMGDRVGLVLFAGETRQAVPLTTHYDDFKQVLETVGPHTLRRGGSKLGNAILAASEGFISKTNDHKAIVIFTDGEDQESNPVEVAKLLHDETGVRIFTIGLGDIEKGARIPDGPSRRGGYMKHDGEQVWSKMNGSILARIATETNGAYIPAGTKRVNMSDVYHGYVANVEQTEFETAKINAYVARFQWFALAALLLLLIDVWWSTRVKDETSAVRNSTSTKDKRTGAGTAAQSTQRAAS